MKFLKKIWKDTFDKSLIKGEDLIKTWDYEKIKDYDIIQCQINLLNYFFHYILPHITKKIILLTSQYNYPGLKESNITQEILDDEKIFLWVSHNHIYKNKSV